jgi:trimeric autotransporter adhesin
VNVAGDPGPPPAVQPPPPPPPPPAPPPARFSLKVEVDPGGGGSVESDFSGISCPGDCATTYAEGTSVKLTAVPAEGMAFDNWLGSCRGDAPTCRLTIDADKTVTARFEPRKP